MPMGYKERGGRLQAFARGKLNDHANHNGPERRGSGPEKRPDTPQIDDPVPSREELLENVRVAIPKVNRTSTPHLRDNIVADRPKPQSPLKPEPTPSSPIINRVEPKMHRPDLFEGSQLGESFMMSGRSTPLSELDHLEVNSYEANEVPGTRATNHGRSRSHYDKWEHEDGRTAFEIGHDGLMKVVTSGARHNPSHMKDGFHNGVPGGQQRSSSSAGRHTKLPTREVKIRKPHADMHEFGVSSPTFDGDHQHYDTKRRVARPFKEEAARPTTRDGCYDETEYDDTDADKLQITPKAKATRAVPQKPLPGISMAAAEVSYNASREKKRRRADPDYDDMVLSSMTFSELQREPFDLDPAKATAQTGHVGGGSLPDKLEQFRHQGDKEQRHMFATMTIDDWENSGDWFVDQFADLMQRLRGARQNKRRMVQEFEYEAASREEAVRLRSEAVDRKLGKMKQDGQRVVDARDL